VGYWEWLFDSPYRDGGSAPVSGRAREGNTSSAGCLMETVDELLDYASRLSDDKLFELHAGIKRLVREARTFFDRTTSAGINWGM
jgi:hypothetical protein